MIVNICAALDCGIGSIVASSNSRAWRIWTTKAREIRAATKGHSREAANGRVISNYVASSSAVCALSFRAGWIQSEEEDYKTNESKMHR